METFKSIVGYPGYEVSDQGRVRSWKGPQPRILKLFKPRQGHWHASLSPSRYALTCASVYRLVLTAFVGPPGEGRKVRHLNGDRSDNRLANLRWGTEAERVADKMAHGTSNRGSGNPATKLSEETARELKTRMEDGERVVHLAREFSLQYQTVYNLKNGNTWGWLSSHPV